MRRNFPAVFSHTNKFRARIIHDEQSRKQFHEIARCINHEENERNKAIKIDNITWDKTAFHTFLPCCCKCATVRTEQKTWMPYEASKWYKAPVWCERSAIVGLTAIRVRSKVFFDSKKSPSLLRDSKPEVNQLHSKTRVLCDSICLKGVAIH